MTRHSMRFIPLVIVLLSSWLVAAPAHAAVELSYFEIEQGSTSTQLIVKWGTETERDTVEFIVKRGNNANPAQSVQVHRTPARGSTVDGSDYQYDDNGLTSGRVYYYWLIELTGSGQEKEIGSTQAVAGGGTAIPTAQPATATPTATPATATPVPIATPVPTATPIPPAATQQQSGAQAPAATATPRLFQDAATATVQPTAMPTSGPINTQAAGVTPASPQAAATDAVAAPVVSAAEEQEKAADAAATVAADLAERGESQQTLPQDPALTPPPTEGESAPTADPLSPNQETDATATPQMLAEAPPAPPAQLVRPTATPRPTDSSGEGDNTSSLLMVIGGGSLCGAALLVLVVFFVWRRR